MATIQDLASNAIKLVVEDGGYTVVYTYGKRFDNGTYDMCEIYSGDKCVESVMVCNDRVATFILASDNNAVSEITRDFLKVYGYLSFI